MIKSVEPLSMPEALEYVKGKSDSEEEARKFVKKFAKMKPATAKEIRKKLDELNMLKMKPEHLVKIIDLMPEDKESTNKIFTDVGLDEDETKKILETLEEFR